MYKLLSKYYNNVVWVGQTFPFKLTFFTIFYVLSLEFWKLLINFRKLRFSLVLVQFVSLDGIVAMFFKRVFRVKLVLFAVGSDILKVQEHIFAYPIIRLIVMKSDFIFCTSSLIAEKLKEMGCAFSKIKVIPSIVDIDDFQPYNGPKIYDIVTVGALDSNKNQMLLIKACELLPSVKVLIVGDGPMRGVLESESAKKKLNTVFLGKISHKQVFANLQKSRIYVHTSKSEGLPVGVLEAMFSNLPVILVKSPYVYDIVRCYGFKVHIIDGNSAESLANKIMKFYETTPLKKEMCYGTNKD